MLTEPELVPSLTFRRLMLSLTGFGIGLFFFYLGAVMLHAYGVDDRVVTPKEDEGEEY